MAVNKATWIKNLFGSLQPLVILGKFQAGATQAVKRGEILALTSGNWVPLGADQVMPATIAIANEEVKSGDLAGYYEIIIPRPGDIFEYALAAAGANAVGTPLYYSDSQTLTITAGTNVLAQIVGQEHYPQKQQHLSDGQVGDNGTTIRSVSYGLVSFNPAVSYYDALSRNSGNGINALSGATMTVTAAMCLGGHVTISHTTTATVNLPAGFPGARVSLTKIDANAAAHTITPDGSEKIQGASTFAAVDAQFDSVTLEWFGGTVGWNIVGKHIS